MAFVLAIGLATPVFGGLSSLNGSAAPHDGFIFDGRPTEVSYTSGSEVSTLESEENRASYETITSWPMFLNNPAHTSYAETPAPSTYAEFWNTTVGTTYSSPAVAEGLVFIGSQGSGVDYMNAYYVDNGTLAWSTPTNQSVAGGQGVRSTPAYWNGHVFFGADKIYCLYANNGTVRWTVDTLNVDYGSGTPTIANGNVFVGTSDAKVHSIDALTGQVDWTFNARTTGPDNYGVLGAPAVVSGLVYVGAGDGYVYQINETQSNATAMANHSFNAKEPVYSSLVVANDRVYFGNGYWLTATKKNRFFALTAFNLTEIWNFDTGGFNIFVSSAGTAYGNVYVASSLGELYAFDALAITPIINWNYTLGESWSSVAIADDKLYIGAKSGHIYAFDTIQTSTVTYLWMQSLGGSVDSSPAISDGLVFVATQNGTGKLYAIGELGDTVAPTISGVLAAPDPQEVGGLVNVSALIADASGVDEAWLNVTLPESMMLVSNPMLHDTPSGRYFYEATYNELGIHNFLVSARDRAGNWNVTLGQFETVDTTPPFILDVTAVPDPQEPFAPVNISTAVSDNHKILEAWVDIVDPNSIPVGNFSMSYDVGADRYFYERTYSEIGTYDYTVWVRDVAGNWNSSSATFIIRDITLPEINAVLALPDPQEVFNPVNISANITDDVAVVLSSVEIRDPMGALMGNFTMSFDFSSARYYEEFTGSMIGMYTFTIWATDSSSNTVSSGGSFILEDWTRPTIMEIAAVPDPQEVLDPVNITTRVIDNYAVAGAFVEITDPSSTPYGNFTMTFDSGTGKHYYEDPYAMLGTWNIRVSAVDESNNWVSGADAFLIQDTLPPTIALVTANPDPQVIDGYVNVSAQVTDNYVLSSVTINITDPDSLTVYDGPMDYDPISARYYRDTTYHKVGVFNFKIIANDSVGNPNEQSGQFTMVSSPIDVQPPQIWDATADPDPQEVFGNVNITARVVDNFAVGIVWVHVYDPSMALLGNFSMSFDSGSGKHFYESPYLEIGGYTFQISANDTSGNVNSTTGVFQIIDTTPPEISNKAVDPEPQEVFGTSQASARVTDNYELSEVRINITDPLGATVGNFTMSFSVDVYYYDQTCELVGEYELLISAADSSGNWDSALVLLHCVDSTNPIVDATAAPDPQEVHGYVNISAQVQENYALDGAWVEIHDPDGFLIGNFSMAFDSSESKYYYLNLYSKLGTYSYVVSAMDTSSNWGAEAATFQMRDATPPIADAGLDIPTSVGDLVTFDASGSTDNYGIASYEWTFNDGTGDKVLNGLTASHTFPEIGSFPVQLKVEDHSGNYDTDTMFVNVNVAPAPSPPTNLRVTDVGADFLVLEWDAPTTNADGSTLTDLVGYHYYRSFTQGGPYARLTGEPFAGTTLTDEFLHPGFKAYYVITAVNSIGLESIYSNEALGETLQKGCIEGMVVDKNGDPIPGALVELLGDREIVITSTNTNSAGEYSFEDLFSGRYTVRGSKAGYTTASLVVDVAYGDATQPEQLVLEKAVQAGFEEALNLPILIPIILIVVVIAIILLMRRRKRKKMVYEMLEGLDIDDLELEVY
jgi:outer membrane protein assembly factor BamB